MPEHTEEVTYKNRAQWTARVYEVYGTGVLWHEAAPFIHARAHNQIVARFRLNPGQSITSRFATGTGHVLDKPNPQLIT